MKGLDTNVVLRYLLQDDRAQAATVNKLMEQLGGPDGPGFISLPTMLEVAWVLRSRYRMARSEVATALDSLLSTDALLIQNERELFTAVASLREDLGSFEDALIGALGQWIGCTVTLTFDKKASRLPGFELVP